MEETHHAAVTGDLVASRKASPASRAKVQQETLKVIEELNKDLQQDLARPAVLTGGDEIQALFRVPSRAVEFVQVIRDRLYSSATPHQDIVFGVGWGALSTGLLPEATSVEQLDGTCFHLARETLTIAKKRKTWVVLHGFGTDEDRTLTSLFELMGAIRAGWTIKQSRYTVDLRELGQRISVARLHGVSPSVITESLQQSHIEAIMNGEEAARLILHQFDPTNEEAETR
jgi:SatD family (SatD)